MQAPSFFKAYDIRGKYPDEISPEDVFRIGRAIAVAFKPKTVAIGVDMRPASQTFLHELVHALAQHKVDVTVLGMCTTPLLSYTTRVGKFDLGIMVTASHSTKEYAGLKITHKDGVPVAQGYGMEKLSDAFLELKESKIKSERTPKVSHRSNIKEYLLAVKKALVLQRKMRVVVDYGNGVGSVTAKHLFATEEKLEVISLFETPDGSFPNHTPNPALEKNLEALSKAVRKHNADIGIAFDGDGDRVGFIDEKGRPIPTDIASILLALFELEKRKGVIYHDLRFNRAFNEVITEAGGTPMKLRVGNPYYKIALLQEGGLMGVEYSGHIMYKDHFGIDDALYAACKMLTILSKGKARFSARIKPYLRYASIPELSIPIKHEFNLARLEQAFKDEQQDHLDGLTVEGKGFWFNVRKSNTEPVVRITGGATSRLKAFLLKRKLVTFIK